jgi:hypothetical protein
MCTVLVVVANILREQAFQVAFVNCNDVIQEITPATSERIQMEMLLATAGRSTSLSDAL